MLRSSTSGKGAPASSEARAPLPPGARSPSGRAAPLRGFGWSVRSVASFAARHRSECAGFPFGMRVREGPVSGPAGRGRTFPIPPRLPAARRTPMREPGPVPPPGCLPDVPGRPDPALPPDGLPDTANPSQQLIPPAVRWKFLGEPDLVSPASPLPGDCGLMLPIGKGSPHGGRTRASRGRTNVSRETTSRRAQSCSKRVNGPPLRGEGFSVIDDCRFLPVSGFERDRRSGRVPPSALCLPSRPISKLSCALRCRVSSACGLRKASSSAHLALGCANCGNGFQIIS
ncbi:hypothetical protein BN3658_01256 [Coriobacteriaceae bacterium CHKCI002]|nr:hypothetical protein BN3658_01256 [Coriobacteriaceae bacterium CHKCI002]